MVSDDQIWKLTFHAQGMASGTGPDESCRCALATALLKPLKLEHLKDILAKALTMVLDGGSHMLQYAGRRSPLLGTHLLQGLIT